MTEQHEQEQRIPLAEEVLRVGKQEVATGRVRVRTVVEEQPALFRETLTRTSLDVERVPIGREVGSVPEPREEDGVLVIPIVEERLVVEKRLFLVEEMRVRRATATEEVEVPASRRVMRAVVERDGQDIAIEGVNR